MRRSRLLGLVAGLAVAGLLWLAWPWLFGANFHQVMPGVYRSGQMSAAALERVIERHGLKAIVNLRGPAAGAAWYEAERDVTRRRGVRHVDLAFSERRLPGRPPLARLIELLHTLPKPILVHCTAGADRAGVASAVARLVLDDASLADARGELSLRYGHLLIGPGAEVAHVLDLYEQYLRDTGARAADFERWVREVYVPYVYSAEIEVLTLADRATPGQALEARLRITNTSPGAWRLSASRAYGVKVGLRLQSVGQASWVDFDRAGLMRKIVQPGEAMEITHVFLAPATPGAYRLKIDLVDEHVTWFEDQGSRPVIRPLQVFGQYP